MSLGAIAALVDDLDLTLDRDELVAAFGIRDRFDARLTVAVAEYEAAGLHELDGCVSLHGWLRQQAGRDSRSAGRLAFTGRKLRQLAGAARRRAGRTADRWAGRRRAGQCPGAAPGALRRPRGRTGTAAGAVDCRSDPHRDGRLETEGRRPRRQPGTGRSRQRVARFQDAGCPRGAAGLLRRRSHRCRGGGFAGRRPPGLRPHPGPAPRPRSRSGVPALLGPPTDPHRGPAPPPPQRRHRLRGLRRPARGHLPRHRPAGVPRRVGQAGL